MNDGQSFRVTRIHEDLKVWLLISKVLPLKMARNATLKGPHVRFIVHLGPVQTTKHFEDCLSLQCIFAFILLSEHMENFPEVYIRPSKRLKFTSSKQSLEEMIHMPIHLTLQESAQAALRDLLVSQMPQQFCSVGIQGGFHLHPIWSWTSEWLQFPWITRYKSCNDI